MTPKYGRISRNFLTGNCASCQSVIATPVVVEDAQAVVPRYIPQVFEIECPACKVLNRWMEHVGAFYLATIGCVAKKKARG